MKEYVFTLTDGGSDGIPFYSETVRVTIETGATWDKETLAAFTESIGHAMKTDFGSHRPRVTIMTNAERTRVL